jgi:hypothetical protein
MFVVIVMSLIMCLIFGQVIWAGFLLILALIEKQIKGNEKKKRL